MKTTKVARTMALQFFYHRLCNVRGAVELQCVHSPVVAKQTGQNFEALKTTIDHLATDAKNTVILHVVGNIESIKYQKIIIATIRNEISFFSK